MTDLLSILIVTYNNEETIKKCLTSIKKSTKCRYEVIIVDNNSFDKTSNIIRQITFPVKFLPQKANLGFSKGYNLAAKNSSGNHLFFLNPDTEILDGAINKLFQYAKDHPEVGIVAPQLWENDKTIQPTVRKLPTVVGAFKEYYLQQKNMYEPYFMTRDQPTEVESVVGAAMLMSKSFFEDVGGWNEKFFLYYEDLDLCRRVLRKGKKIIYLPTAKIKHYVGTSGRSNPNVSKFLKESAIVYHGRLYFWILNLLLKFRWVVNL